MIDAKLYMTDNFYYNAVTCLIKDIMRYEKTPREKERERSNELFINNTIESLCELRSKLALEQIDK